MDFIFNPLTSAFFGFPHKNQKGGKMVIVGKSISGSFDDLAICAGAAALEARQGRKNVDSHRREANLKMEDFFQIKDTSQKRQN